MTAAQIVAQMQQAAAEGLTEAAEFVRNETRLRTPDDPATSGDDLSGSLTVDPATPRALEASVYTDAEHAIYQHEALNIQHPTGEAKFLENTSRESVRDAERIIAAAVRRHFG